jgi:hypothetical protein
LKNLCNLREDLAMEEKYNQDFISKSSPLSCFLFFSKKNILINNVSEKKNILILVEKKKIGFRVFVI